MKPEGVISGLGDFFASVPQMAESAGEAAQGAVVGAIARKVPLYGVLFTYDAEGVRFTKAGQIILGAMATYGLIRFVGR